MNLRDKLRDMTASLRDRYQSSHFLSTINEKAGFLDKFKHSLAPLLSKFRVQNYSNLIGIDIGFDNLKLIKIDASHDPYQVQYLAIAPMPMGAITKEGIKDSNAIGNLLRDMFKESALTANSVALAIPRSNAIIKTITIDKRLTSEEIESRAWIEANRHFPDLIGDIHLDFTITGVSLQDPNQLELMLVACRKDHVKPYLEIMRLAGLSPKIVDVNSYALARTLPLLIEKDRQKDTFAILNLNMILSSFIVMQDMRLVHAHDQSYDGSRLVTQANAFLKDKRELHNNNLLEDTTYYGLLKESLISHLRHTVHFFYSSKPNVNIQRIILAGECATVPALAAFIEKELGVETKIAEPFKNLGLAPHVDPADVKKYGPAMLLACGLALSKLEFD